MTTVLSFSGVHGAGKTTIIEALIQKMYVDNPKVRIFRMKEMSHIPPFKAGSPEFQMWYAKEMLMRGDLVIALLKQDLDFIILDRLFIDVQVYNMAGKFGESVHDLTDSLADILSVINYNMNSMLLGFDFRPMMITRDLDLIIEGNKARAEIEPHRKAWADTETDYEYLETIDMLFQNTWERMASTDSPHKYTIHSNNGLLSYVVNRIYYSLPLPL